MPREERVRGSGDRSTDRGMSQRPDGDWESPRWREGDDAQGDVERNRRLRDDRAPAQLGAIDESKSIDPERSDASQEGPMPRVTVGPKTGGGWQVTGEQQVFKTQRAAEQAARRQLANGGGELVVKGRDGRIRLQNTIGRPDPRRSRG
jgi:Uncharacterized protein conserved in bacteria (DUF2188)